jgi:hypothetical protein
MKNNRLAIKVQLICLHTSIKNKCDNVNRKLQILSTKFHNCQKFPTNNVFLEGFLEKSISPINARGP